MRIMPFGSCSPRPLPRSLIFPHPIRNVCENSLSLFRSPHLLVYQTIQTVLPFGDRSFSHLILNSVGTRVHLDSEILTSRMSPRSLTSQVMEGHCMFSCLRCSNGLIWLSSVGGYLSRLRLSCPEDCYAQRPRNYAEATPSMQAKRVMCSEYWDSDSD